MADVTEAPSPATFVRDIVAAADRRRRVQSVGRQLARWAPRAAALLVLISFLAKIGGWPLLVTLGVSGAMLLVAGSWALAALRTRPATDAVVTEIDAAAGLAGELRSAHWFASASTPVEDEWAAFHLGQAVRRGSAVVWRDVYPPVRARRAWLAAVVLAIGAFALPAGLPTGSGARASAPSVVEALAGAADLEGLPPELRDQILELLAAVREGRIAPQNALAALRTLTEFAKVDPALQQQIADLVANAVPDRDQSVRTSAPSLADAGEMTGDIEWARENMASRLASEEAQQSEEGKPTDSESSEDPKDGPTTEQAAEGEAGEASVGKTGARVPIKAADGADAAAGMMLRDSSSTTGEPGSAFGGKRGNVRYGTSDISEIAAALKRETIEANVNVDRSNLDKEDRRRKTEQSWSALRYTSAAGRGGFDRAHTDAPRNVPEVRKPLVARYFVREAPADDEPPAAAPPAAGARD